MDRGPLMGKMANKQQKRVVVVGYGIGGSRFVAQARKRYPTWELTVITPFDYQEVPVQMTEAIAAGPEAHSKVIYPILKEPNVHYIFDIVNSMTSDAIHTRQHRTIGFDIAVIAVGQKIPLFYPNPLTEPTLLQRKRSIADLHRCIVQGDHIVVAGGGAVGTEVAADIKLRFPTKSVVLVHSHAEILNSMERPFRDLALHQLTTTPINLRIILQNRVIRPDHPTSFVAKNTMEKTVQLASGETIPCDVFLTAHPEGGNASFLPAFARDERNYAVVNDMFLVQGFANVFAFGDCTNYDRVKTIPRVDNQLRTLFHNIGCIASAPSLPSSFLDLIQTTPAEPVLESIHPTSYQASSSIAPAIPPSSSSSSPPSSSPSTIAAAAASVSSKVESMVPNLRHHVKDYLGSLPGPALVAFGHHHSRGTGVGLAMPGCVGCLCWACCIFGWPCRTPGGHSAALAKSLLNDTVAPKPGRGMDR